MNFVILFYYDRKLQKGYYTNSIFTNDGKLCIINEKVNICFWSQFKRYICYKEESNFNNSSGNSNEYLFLIEDLLKLEENLIEEEEEFFSFLYSNSNSNNSINSTVIFPLSNIHPEVIKFINTDSNLFKSYKNIILHRIPRKKDNITIFYYENIPINYEYYNNQCYNSFSILK